jgi:[citrate (pro-3S)-lyase] ligase
LFGINIRTIERPGLEDRALLEVFLHGFGLFWEGQPDVSVLVEDDGNRLIGTGSLSGNVIKMMAVDPEWQEYGLSGTIVSSLVEWGRARGKTHFFVFTKPESADPFIRFGFREIARYDPFAVLLEMGIPGIDQFREYLSSCRRGDIPAGKVGGVVVNCNPFTRGHLFLIERAASLSAHLYVVVVEADLSSFPFRDRIEMVKCGTSHLPNVTVLRSGDYAVSPATFPSYFLKDASQAEIASIQARIDVTLFGNLFVPELGISVRFVGTEPYCPVTGAYNEAMREVLPPLGVDLHVIPRLEIERGLVVSASMVRSMLKCGNWEIVRKMVPDCTWEYLHTDRGKDAVERIRRAQGRH